MIRDIRLFKTEVSDQYIQQNFVRLNDELAAEPILRAAFKFMSFSLKAGANQKVTHNLGFLPKDVIQTGVTGNAVVTYNFDLFDNTRLDVSSSADCVVRILIGTYKENN